MVSFEKVGDKVSVQGKNRTHTVIVLIDVRGGSNLILLHLAK